MVRAIYSLFWFLGQPFVLFRLWWRGKRVPAYRERYLERFGAIPASIPAGVLWIHAVSVGETIAAVPLIRVLQEQYPKQPLLVTSMTPTGSAQVKRSFGDSVHHCYLPYDIPYVLKRFLKRTKPKGLVLMESELWPNLLYYAAKNHIPVLIANARLSPKTQERYLCLKPLLGSMLENISCVAAQSEPDRQAYVRVGVPEGKVRLLGNLKFDFEPPPEQLEQGHALKHLIGERPVWIAASTHAGEEEIVLQAHRAVLKVLPNALLILVPRHPNRFDEIATMLLADNWAFKRRSKQEAVLPGTTLYLGDTMGEMFCFYAAAHCAFVGGSLIAGIGGHNTLEPASLGLPVLVGPYNHNFVSITEWLTQAKGLLTVADPIQMADTVVALLENPSKAIHMGACAKTVVHANQGAVARHLSCLQEWIQLT